MRRFRLVVLMAAIAVTFTSQARANLCYYLLPEPDQVIIYQETDRGGLCQVLGLGNYPTPSFYGLPNDSISSIDVGSNVRAVLYENINFKGRQAHYEGGGYYTLGNDNNRASSIEIFPRLGGPAAAYYLGAYPSSRKNFWSEEAQGLANDGMHWFVTKKGRIFQVPLSSDLNNKHSSGLIQTGIPPQLKDMGYDHFGDPDQSKGFLFAPVEKMGDNDSVPHIAVFNTVDLHFRSSFALPASYGGSAPWLAIHPKEGTLWTSSSRLSDGREPNQIRVYDIFWDRLKKDGQLLLTFRRQVILKDRQGQTLTLESMQGGVFNPEGTLLYLSTGPCDEHGYVYVFAIDETDTAHLQARSENRYGPFNFRTDPATFPIFDFCSRDEAEGLDWLDVRGLDVPGIPDGQLHVMKIDNDLYTDKVWLEHYSY